MTEPVPDNEVLARLIYSSENVDGTGQIQAGEFNNQDVTDPHTRGGWSFIRVALTRADEVNRLLDEFVSRKPDKHRKMGVATVKVSSLRDVFQRANIEGEAIIDPIKDFANPYAHALVRAKDGAKLTKAQARLLRQELLVELSTLCRVEDVWP